MFHGVFTLCVLIFTLKFCEVKCKNGCGIMRQKTNDRIVNGEEIGYAKYPWFAGLFSSKDPRGLICGGSLISERFLLTAAHCYKPHFKPYLNGDITLEEIYVVKLDINNICISEPHTQIKKVAKVYIPEPYFSNLLYYDIALIALENVVRLTPICLPKARYDSNNRTNLKGTIVGLGKERSTSWRLPCAVREANVPIQSDSVCIQMLKVQKGNYPTFQDAFCAGDPDKGIDTCQGDSGGPLQVYQEDSNTWMILGLTSFGFGCAKKDTYGVYTDLSHFIDWIRENMYSYIPNNSNKSPSAPSTTRSVQRRPIKKAGRYDWLKELISI